MNEEKGRKNKRKSSHTQGRETSKIVMVHTMRKYSELYTDLNFIKIPKETLELCSVTDSNKKI